MKKLFNNLPFRLLLGIIIGVILGQVFPESVMKVVVTLQYIMGQLITFCVPLIIIGPHELRRRLRPHPAPVHRH